jgi:hypothetical protein
MTYQDTRPERAARPADTDGKAVVGFISGLVGLLFGNIILGPIAIVLGAMAAPPSRSASASPTWSCSPRWRRTTQAATAASSGTSRGCEPATRRKTRSA